MKVGCTNKPLALWELRILLGVGAIGMVGSILAGVAIAIMAINILFNIGG